MTHDRLALFCALSLLLGCNNPPAGVADASVPDSGSELDAGATPDGGAMTDGGSMPDGGMVQPTIEFLDARQHPVTTIYFTALSSVRISGVPPGREVKLSAEMSPWKSSVTFQATVDGTVDTARDAPTSGSYSGVDADGPFWSMNTPTFAFAQSADVLFVASVDGQPPLSATLHRSFQLPGLRIVQPEADAGVVGRLFVPPGTGPFPGILAFGGSEGGQSGGVSYAGDLVPEGYAVLAIAYFADTGLPADLKDVPLEYLDGALEWLKKRPEVNAQKLGVIGGSRGGELSLLVAARHPELKAAIADAPSGYVWGSTTPPGAGWTSAGIPVPFIPSHGLQPDVVASPQGAMAYAFTPVFDDDVAHATAAVREAARIKVENAGAAIAMFAGADDQLWPSCKLAQVAMDKLVATGHALTHPDELTCFPAAGHLVGSVGYPTTWSAFVESFGEVLALGGTPAGTAHAGRARQTRVRAFLTATLGGSGP
jgi:dienelactone hydrolase